jgi:hypothetical protein
MGKESQSIGGLGLRAGMVSDFAVHGMDGFVQITDRTQVGLILLQGADIASGNFSDMQIQYAGLEGRYFIMQGTSLAGGLAYRQIDAVFNGTYSGVTGSYRQNSVLLSSDISSVWNLDRGFYVGVNWLGAMYSVSDRSTDRLQADREQARERAAWSVENSIPKFSLRTMLTSGYRF